MNSGSESPTRRVKRWVVGLVIGLGGLVAWLLMMNAAQRGLSFEPNSDVAIARAAAARPVGIGWSSVLVVLGVALALHTRHGWLALLGLPGLAVLITLVAPVGNGGAFVYGLLSSVVAALLTIGLETHHVLKMREAREQPVHGVSPAEPAPGG